MAFFTNFLQRFAEMKAPIAFLALSIFMVFLFPASVVRAEDGPFQLEKTQWMSFDRYKENTKHGTATVAPEPAPDDKTDAAQNGASPDAHDANGDSANITPPAMAPEVAAPTRPINVPIMPGMNKGYDVRVTSTEDERPPIAQITHIDTEPTVSLPSRNWLTPKEATHHLGSSVDGDEEHTPLDVRMSFLPNTHITPIPSSDYKSNHGRKPPAPAAAPIEPEKKAADLAACAAIDAYKKKQLEAIESDRQTLTDLQKAIAQLGLQKELSFMAGANGHVNQADSSNVQIDMPPSLARPAKN